MVVALDQITKQWVTAALTYGEPVVFTPLFNFTLLYNVDAAFCFLSEAGGWQRWFLTAMAVVVSVALVIWLARVFVTIPFEPLDLALISGGVLGNVYDRVL